METSNYNENKMGVMPINKLLITMSLPMIISMLVQALYNVVDSIFVSQISENALRKEQGLGARVLSCYTLKKEL